MMGASMRPSIHLVASDETLDDGNGGRVRVVLQSATSQVYVLADSTLQLLRTRPSDLSAAEQQEMLDAGLLVAGDRDEFAEVIGENQAKLASRTTRSFVLMPAAYCNMGCGYCGQQHFQLPQASQHRKAISRRLLLAVTSAETTGVHISWFGAEPMMGYAQILDISQEVTQACEAAGKTYSSKIVTNGALLTLAKIRRLYLDAKVTSFEITIDGPPDRHNAQRPLKSGQASYHKITSVIKAACADAELADLKFTIRTNVSRANQNEHQEFAAAAFAAGIVHPRVSFYTAIVRAWGNDVSDYAVPTQDLVGVERNWLDAYAAYGLRGGGLPIHRKYGVCVTVDPRAEVIAPTGEVHSCTEQPLVPSRAGSEIGHVTSLQTPEYRPAGKFDDWNGQLLRGETQAYCPTCSIFPICGGACPLVWHEGSPACPPLKTTMPMRLTRYGESLGYQSTS